MNSRKNVTKTSSLKNLLETHESNNKVGSIFTAMKGVMRTVSSTDRERESLLKQNGVMALEITRLREIIANLKQKNRALTVSSLKLAGSTKDVATQTDNVRIDPAPRENPVEKVLARFPTSDKTEYNPLLRERMKYSNSLKFSTDELLTYEETIPTPEVSKFSPKSKAKSPQSSLSPRMLNSPVMKKKLFHGISDRIVRALYPTSGRSPLRDDDHSGPAPFSPQPKKEKHTAEVTPPLMLDRTPRRVRKPTSYKEHSLKVKVRRSFKFIQYEEPPEEPKKELQEVPEEDSVHEDVV